jgi:hypothetical protein
MTPLIGRGSDKVDSLTLSILKDLGYTLVPNAVTTSTKQ